MTTEERKSALLKEATELLSEIVLKGDASGTHIQRASEIVTKAISSNAVQFPRAA